ncbi:MAG: hypothetical protein ACUVTM_01055 [Candidatus Bathyarchaeia archaeon]
MESLKENLFKQSPKNIGWKTVKVAILSVKSTAFNQPETMRTRMSYVTARW